jgi:hypothetical protein
LQQEGKIVSVPKIGRRERGAGEVEEVEKVGEVGEVGEVGSR